MFFFTDLIALMIKFLISRRFLWGFEAIDSASHKFWFQKPQKPWKIHHSNHSWTFGWFWTNKHEAVRPYLRLRKIWSKSIVLGPPIYLINEHYFSKIIFINPSYYQKRHLDLPFRIRKNPDSGNPVSGIRIFWNGKMHFSLIMKNNL